MRFVDTNVLLYAVSTSPEDFVKRRRAQALLKESGLAVSVQVLQEFYYQAVRRGAMTHEDAFLFLGPILKLPVQHITLDVFHLLLAQRAIDIRTPAEIDHAQGQEYKEEV